MTSGLPQVSVVLPVRNGGAKLITAIRSIQNQSFSDWELIVADDGSTDGSRKVTRQFAERDSRVRPLNLPAQGLVPTLTAALELCRGTFIARMDADDVSHPKRLERQRAVIIEDTSLGLISCLVVFGGSRQGSRGYAEHVDWLNRTRTSKEIANSRFVESPVAHPSVFFRRELLSRLGGYREGDFPEDYELWLRWLDAGVRFSKVAEPLLLWNDAPDRLSRIDDRYSPEAFYRVKCLYLSRWLERHIPRERPIWLWGAGRTTRKRFAALERERGGFDGFVDVDPDKTGLRLDGRPVVAPDDIPEGAFLIAAVGSRGARGEIRNFLRRTGREEGRDFLCAA